MSPLSVCEIQGRQGNADQLSNARPLRKCRRGAVGDFEHEGAEYVRTRRCVPLGKHPHQNPTESCPLRLEEFRVANGKRFVEARPPQQLKRQNAPARIASPVCRPVTDHRDHPVRILDTLEQRGNLWYILRGVRFQQLEENLFFAAEVGVKRSLAVSRILRNKVDRGVLVADARNDLMRGSEKSRSRTGLAFLAREARRAELAIPRSRFETDPIACPNLKTHANAPLRRSMPLSVASGYLPSRGLASVIRDRGRFELGPRRRS